MSFAVSYAHLFLVSVESGPVCDINVIYIGIFISLSLNLILFAREDINPSLEFPNTELSVIVREATLNNTLSINPVKVSHLISYSVGEPVGQ